MSALDAAMAALNGPAASDAGVRPLPAGPSPLAWAGGAAAAVVVIGGGVVAARKRRRAR